MKKAFKLAAIALCAGAMMVACNNNATEEVALDTMPAIDTTVVDTVVTDTVVEEAPVAETPAPAKAKTPAKKQKTKVEEVKEGIQTVKAVSLQTKKNVQEVTDELQKGGEGSIAVGSTKSDPLGAKKKPAAEAFKK